MFVNRVNRPFGFSLVELLNVSHMKNAAGRPGNDLALLDQFQVKVHRFYENKEAQAYMELRGFRMAELYSRFKIGFTDGSLIPMVPNGKAKRCSSVKPLRP